MLGSVTRAMLKLLYTCLALHLLLPVAIEAQEIPPIACPNYFQYLAYENQYIGKVTLPTLPGGSVKVDVGFSQRVPIQSSYYGSLSLFDKKNEVRNLERGIPISYRVDFPFPNVLPKLTKIAVNDQVICSASDYSAPSTTLSLQHTLRTNTLSSAIASIVPGAGPNTFGVDLYDPSPPKVNPNNNNNYYPESPVVNNNNPFLPPRGGTPTPVIDEQPRIQSNTVNSGCGKEGSTFKPFVFGGEQLERGQFPWLVAIYLKSSLGLVFICGGSLLSSRTVLSAAHCFINTNANASSIALYLGRHNLNDYNEEEIVSRDVKELIINPEYDRNYIFPDADLALLQLKSPVSFNSYIAPICLWSESIDISLILNQKAFVAGWGSDEKGAPITPLPKKVDVKIVSEAECLRSNAGFRKLTSSRTLCAGNRDDTGPCEGDSGGGLMLKRNGFWTLRGVVSAGPVDKDRCNLREYAIYCDLAKHMTWVRANMK